ncbi:universal stress protein [Longispora sp. K20-0274]|uniref:universal stress protein n=1 Tax=Longispora sp. K20-0274 TaxID=3088255 RepID=UPI00399B28E0
MTQQPSVVVGVDGSASSLAAVALAAREAHLRNAPLRILSAVPAMGGTVSYEEAQRSLTQARYTVAGHRDITTDVMTGGPAAVLIAAGQDAQLLVVGHRGRGGFKGLLAGSVATQVAEYAGCPVMIARDGPQLHTPEYPRLPVYLGVDIADSAVAACAFAFTEAALRGVALHALHAWTGHTRGDRPPPVFDREHDRAARTLAAHLAPVRARYPDVDVYHEVALEPARTALISASCRAGLVVVGSHGPAGLTGIRIGSVSQALIRRAHCPVVIAQPTAPAPG